MNAISENALDRYVAEREAYEQNRNYKIKNG
jgi:ABC-type transporter lipoprotein component MlaA